MRFLINQLNITEEQARELLLRPRPKVAVDVEYVSFTNTLPLGVAIAVDRDTGFYFFNPKDELVKQVLESTPIILLQNAASDIPIFNKLGIQLQRYEDTMLLAYSAGILEKSLEALSTSILHRPCPSVTEQWEGRSVKLKEQGNVAIDHVKMGQMCMIHACNTYALWEAIPRTQLYWDIDRPCIDLVIEMEHWGLLIDQYRLTLVEQQTIDKTSPMEKELKEELGVENLSSNPQVAEALRTKGIIGTRKTKGAKDSVGEESLKPLNLPVTNKLLKWRSLQKTLSTYVPQFRNVRADGRVSTKYGYTKTGRWNSSEPNLQNITRDEQFEDREVGRYNGHS